MQFPPFPKIILSLLAIDIALSATISILQPDIAIVRSALSAIELAALVTTMTVVVWRVFRSF